MVKNLLKTPFTAVFFASLLMFLLVFIPFSQGYADARAQLVIPLIGYLFMIAYGLWLSIATVLMFSGTYHKGIKLILFTLLPLLVSQWIAPMLSQIVFGETTQVMTQMDSLLELARAAVSTILTFFLMFFLRTPENPEAAPPTPGKKQAEKPEVKFKLRRIRLLIMMLVLPVIYMFIYFLVRYFLLWRVEAVRVYYTGDAEAKRVIQYIINMLLTDGKQVPMALVRGLVYAACLIPLLFQLVAKRIWFILISVMLFLGAVVQLLIPNPVMPVDIQRAHIIPLVIELTLYAALSAFLLYLCIHKEIIEPPPPPPETVHRPKRRKVPPKDAAADSAEQAEAAPPPA